MKRFATFEEAAKAGLVSVDVRKSHSGKVRMIGRYRLDVADDNAWETMESSAFDEGEIATRRALFEHAVFFAFKLVPRVSLRQRS